MFITAKGGRAFLAFDRNRSEFGIEASSRNRPSRAGLRHQCIFVLLLARDLVVLSQHFGGFAHHHLRHRTKESVAIHSVDQILIAQPVSPARFKIIRNPRHRFRAARKNATRIAKQNRLVSQCDRFHPRSASFVHRKRRRFLRHAAANRNLPRHVRSAPSLPRAAENGFFHLLGLDTRALDSSLGRHHAHISRGQRCQRSAKLPNRRARPGKNVNSLQSVASKTFESSRVGKDAAGA